MDSSNGQQDSPLSISASITGILTFIVAITAAAYARITYLRNCDDEYFRVKTSLSWYKTESAWLAELLRALDTSSSHTGNGNGNGNGFRQRTEYQMYKFVMDNLLNLEQRLLDFVDEIEVKAAERDQTGTSWTLLPRSWQGGRRSVALSWLSVRTKAMELVRQREAMTARVQFLQMSMISSRISDLELRMRVQEMGEKREEVNRLVERIPLAGDFDHVRIFLSGKTL